MFSPQDEVHDKEDNKDSSSNKTGSQDRIRWKKYSQQKDSLELNLTFPCFSTEGLVKSSRNVTSWETEENKENNASRSERTSIGGWKEAKTSKEEGEESHDYNLWHLFYEAAGIIDDLPGYRSRREQKTALA